MYIPAAFQVEDHARLAAFLQQNSFATLVTFDGTAPFASHLPVLYRPQTRTLVSHLARANPQWQHFAEGRHLAEAGVLVGLVADAVGDRLFDVGERAAPEPVVIDEVRIIVEDEPTLQARPVHPTDQQDECAQADS